VSVDVLQIQRVDREACRFAFGIVTGDAVLRQNGGSSDRAKALCHRCLAGLKACVTGLNACLTGVKTCMAGLKACMTRLKVSTTYWR
jgi:hypothetical protein